MRKNVQYNMRNNERGYVLGLVVIALVALSIGGASILTLAGGETDLAGQVRKQKQLEACAYAGADATIAKLPSTAGAVNYVLDTNYTTKPNHYQSGTTAVSATAPVSAPFATAAAMAGGNIVNRYEVGGGAEGNGGMTKIAYRMVDVCQGPNNQESEAEKIVLYGADQ